MGRRADHRELATALAKRQPVRLSRRLDGAERLDGFVVGLRDDWALLHRTYDVQLDGWTAVRLDTVAGVERGRRKDLLPRVLKSRGQHPHAFDVDLSSIQTVIASAARRYPLVSFMREAKRPGSSSIGWPVDLTGKRVVLFEITPQATWAKGARALRLSRITRVDMGNDYHAALHELGGFPPLA